ncbi:MAG: tripartite tricarboxylate transporter TctB family protein [Advenella sp.]|uniref:DUF1468 domain-containing protein n=1 Tax=Advenella kashmirensis TaxID=310575 RepID=A0A356LJD2_9BURK|nr:tripartite tricarboxylate transporter TctB family protein [Advenella sp. FME57]HBP31120.1 hypothetical protein [Advenella kashmirensis]
MKQNRSDLLSAGLLLLLGIGVALGGMQYGIGSLARMGPGYFPLLLGLLLIGIGVLIAATPSSSDTSGDGASMSGLAVRPWLCVVGGVLCFIILGQYGGLVPATFALIFISALGDRNNSIQVALALAACVTIAAVGIFYYGMQIQFPLFVWG